MQGKSLGYRGRMLYLKDCHEAGENPKRNSEARPQYRLNANGPLAVHKERCGSRKRTLCA